MGESYEEIEAPLDRAKAGCLWGNTHQAGTGKGMSMDGVGSVRCDVPKSKNEALDKLLGDIFERVIHRKRAKCLGRLQSFRGVGRV